MSYARLGGAAAVLGGMLAATAVIGSRVDSDPDLWDCNSLADHVWEAADSGGLFLIGAAFLALRNVQGARGGRAGDSGSLLGAFGSVAVAISNPLEHCAGFPAIGFVLGVVLLSFGTLLLGVSMLRAAVLPRWAAVALLISAVAPFALGEPGVIVSGLAWLLVGVVLLRGGGQRARTLA